MTEMPIRTPGLGEKGVRNLFSCRRERKTGKIGNGAGQSASSLVNEVAFAYGAWGVVTKSTQNHTTGTASTDPNVQYAYEDGIVSNEAKYIRPASVTYPGPSTRRVVYYNYSTSGVGAALGRLGDIADDDSGESGRTKYVDYTLSLPKTPSVLILQDLRFLPRAGLRGRIPVL